MVFEWKPEYNVGVAAMDAQHKKLIAMLNRLSDSMRVGQGRIVQRTIITEMLNYTRTHFAQEELMLQNAGYPGLAAQRAQHAGLLKKLLDVEQREHSAPLSVELLDFLQHWLVDHIVGQDKLYGAWMTDQHPAK